MRSLDFYDLKNKEKFTSRKYTKFSRTVKGNRKYFAETTAPSGVRSVRIISKEDYNSA